MKIHTHLNMCLHTDSHTLEYAYILHIPKCAHGPASTCNVDVPYTSTDIPPVSFPSPNEQIHFTCFPQR